MKELEWISCKSCGKTGWLDINEPARLAGWYSKNLSMGEDNVTFFLCGDCYCLRCPHADTFVAEGFDGKYPDYYCHYPDWNDGLCVHLSVVNGEGNK